MKTLKKFDISTSQVDLSTYDLPDARIDNVVFSYKSVYYGVHAPFDLFKLWNLYNFNKYYYDASFNIYVITRRIYGNFN